MWPSKRPLHHRTLIWAAVIGTVAVLSAAPDRFASAAPFNANVTVYTSKPMGPVNRLVLGNNMQWVDNGDALMIPNSLEFQPNMMARVKELAPTALRYPGGVMGDVYHWWAGVGDLSARGEGEHFFRKDKQKILLGTREVLELCDDLGAALLFHVNVTTAPAWEAAWWVYYTNKVRVRSRTGKLLPTVRYWEIGNEPYLQDAARPELWLSPSDYAARATQFIQNMKAADPGIQIGIPLRSDTIGGVPATPYPGYNKTVLQGIAAPFEFAALHSAYFPFAWDRSYPENDLYWGTMGATAGIETDFASTRAQLKQFVPTRNIKLAVTEYNALYSYDGRPTDGYINTITGAIYVADALRVFATTQDLIMANFWSMSGNGSFGSIWWDATVRPSFHVLKLYNQALRGNRVPATVVGKTFNSPKVGIAAQQFGLPIVTAFAALEGNTLRAVLINKDPVDTAQVSLGLDQLKYMQSGSLQVLTGKSRLDTTGIQIGTGSVVPAAFPVRFQLPKSSITLVEMKL